MIFEKLEKIGIKDTKDIRCFPMPRPWGQAIIQGNRRIINTAWKPPKKLIGKYVFIYSTRKYDKNSVRFMKENGFSPPDEKECQTGIIGMFEIVDYVEKDESPWYFDGYHGWKIGDVISFDEPIRCPVRKGIWPASQKLFMKTSELIKRNSFKLRPEFIFES